MSRSRQLPMEAAGRGGAFHGSASLPSFVLYLDVERCVWAQSAGAAADPAPSLAQGGREITTGILVRFGAFFSSFFFPKLRREALPCPSRAAATLDRAGRWLEAGGRCPAAGSAPGMRGRSGRECFPSFPLLALSVFPSPCYQRSFLPWDSSSCCRMGVHLLEGQRRGKQEAPGMPLPVV